MAQETYPCENCRFRASYDKNPKSLLGGWIWKTLGIETLFMLSAFLGLCNSAYAATIRTGHENLK